ncbi:coagulation factor XIII B chain-like isoform X2 [Syngnathus typhle]|uniref:coagulation factor XIII B chain-like isoform X2 n=1 Tax=Syngnathus typhle TaxID=161592 RepID=UPI002A6A57AA|nr:coagulation factor XIII B chain-like isoform X2 [Syngnathus typhle]
MLTERAVKDRLVLHPCLRVLLVKQPVSNPRCLGFILVLSYPGQLHAQSPAESCAAPLLEGGFIGPELRTYSHGSTLAYACSAGQKPAVEEGWWATSVCLNGLWSHTPQCIDENTCFTPDIPNAKYDESPDGLWYKEGSVIWIKCHEGYEHKTVRATATCRKGVWSALPSCERSDTSCNEPPRIPHAVILGKYQDVFAADVEVRYECEDGYSVEVATTKKSIFCVAGAWTRAASCMVKPGPGDDGDTSGGSTKPVDGNIGRGRGGGATGPDTGDSTDTATAGARTDGSSATGTRPVTTSDKTGTPSSPLLTDVVNCGSYPKVPNGDVVRTKKRSLRYACNGFYKRVGPETVVCYANGTWSQPPTCKEAFCQINLDEYTSYNFQESGTLILKEQETKSVRCTGYYYTSQITCIRGQIRVTPCCHDWSHHYQRCN